MVNSWIEFVKQYASEHGLSYACALSSPGCKESYQQQQNTNYKPQLKRIGALLRPSPTRNRPTPARIQQARDLFNVTMGLVRDLPNSDMKTSYVVKLNRIRTRIENLLATA